MIEVSSAVIEALLGEARGSGAHECCGLLLGQGGSIRAVSPARNIHPEPRTRFELDPATLIAAHRAAREGGPEVLGYYHSHPNGLPRPSATDAAAASGDGRIWAIIARGEVTFWQDTANGLAALPYRQVGDQ